MAESDRHELAATGVEVSILQPGVFNTEVVIDGAPTPSARGATAWTTRRRG